MKRLAKLLPIEDWKAATSPEDQRLVYMIAKDRIWQDPRQLDDEIEQAFEAYLRSSDLTPDSIDKIKKLKSHKLCLSLKLTCALLYFGYTYHESVAYVNRQLAELLELPSPLVVKDIKIKQRAVEVEYPTATLFESLEDAMHSYPIPNFRLVIERLKPSTIEIEKMKTTFNERRKEVMEALAGSDPDLVEAYSHRTKDELKFAVRWYQEALESLGEAKAIIPKDSKPRKPRAKKAKAPGSIVKHMKYQIADAETGLTSIAPEQIIGARSVVCFNTKTRMVHYFVAKDESLNVYRSSVDNFDETKSFKKKLRKPKEQLSVLLAGTRTYFEREFKNIRSKASETVGRIGPTTLILKAYK